MKNLIIKNNSFYTLMLYTLTSIVIVSATAFSQQQELMPENVKNDWDALTKDGGVWITHDNIGSFDAYGMKFT